MNSLPFYLYFTQQNLYSAVQQQHLSLLRAGGHIKHRAGSFSSPKAFFLSLPPPVRAANEGAAISRSSLLVSVKQEQFGMQAVSSVLAVGLSALAG